LYCCFHARIKRGNNSHTSSRIKERVRREGEGYAVWYSPYADEHSYSLIISGKGASQTFRSTGRRRRGYVLSVTVL